MKNKVWETSQKRREKWNKNRRPPLPADWHRQPHAWRQWWWLSWNKSSELYTAPEQATAYIQHPGAPILSHTLLLGTFLFYFYRFYMLSRLHPLFLHDYILRFISLSLLASDLRLTQHETLVRIRQPNQMNKFIRTMRYRARWWSQSKCFIWEPRWILLVLLVVCYLPQNHVAHAITR